MKLRSLRMSLALSACTVLAAFNVDILGQSVNPSSFSAAARQAFNPGADIHSIHLVGTAIFVRGSATDAGAFDFTLSNTGEGQLKISLDSGDWIEHWDAMEPGRSCDRSNSAGTHSISAAECALAVNWIFPQISLQSNTRPQQVSLTEVSSHGGAGTAVPQLIAAVSTAGGDQQVQAFINRWSRATLMFDPQSTRISKMSFAVTPDNGTPIPINVLMLYSDYRMVQGITIPYKIERRINGNSNLILSISSAQAS